jgi:hypothetical protein
MLFVDRSTTTTQILYMSIGLPTCEYSNGGCIKTATNLIIIGSLHNVRPSSSGTTPAGSPPRMKRNGLISPVRPTSGQITMIMRGLALAYPRWRRPRFISGHSRSLY